MLIALFLLLILLILVSAFFSSAETGVLSLNRYRLRFLVKKKHKQALRIEQLLKRADTLFGVVIIGNTLANILASMIATLIGHVLYGSIGVAMATTLLALTILVFAEMLPKTYAALYPQKVAFSVAALLIFFQKLLFPLVKIVSWITTVILQVGGISLTTAQRETLTGEELRSVVNEASSLLPHEHKSMLIGLLDLENATVEDIMIPLSDIGGVDLNKSWFEVLTQLESIQHTRVPLFNGTMDQLLGLVHVRDVLNLSLAERLDKESLMEIMDEPYFVPEGTLLNQQISNFQKEKKRSCFVVDEYGDIQGLVTLEDILEEVIGKFTTDLSTLSKEIIHKDNDCFIVDASITLRQLQRVLGWQFPALGPRTLSGLIIEYLGAIPPPDCCVKIGNYHIEILKVSDNTVKTVKIYHNKA